MILGEEVDEEVAKVLNPSRFDGGESDKLREKALARYNDIYNNVLIHSVVELHIDPELTNHQRSQDLVMKAKIWIRSNAIFHPLPHNIQVKLNHWQRELERLS